MISLRPEYATKLSLRFFPEMEDISRLQPLCDYMPTEDLSWLLSLSSPDCSEPAFWIRERAQSLPWPTLQTSLDEQPSYYPLQGRSHYHPRPSWPNPVTQEHQPEHIALHIPMHHDKQTRRQDQNRQSQRTYRNRNKSYITELEAETAQWKVKHDDMSDIVAMQDDELQRLRDQLDALECKRRMLMDMPIPGWLRDVDQLILQSRVRRRQGEGCPLR